MIKNELTKRIFSSLILIPIVFFVVSEGSFLFNFFILICFLITSYEWHRMSKRKSYYFFGLFFLVLSFYSAFEIRTIIPGSYYYFLSVLLICISTDVGGYIFGNFFKGPKLTKISPKKTYSGVVGGYLFSIIFFNFALSTTLFFPNSQELTAEIFIFILLISTVSQLVI